MTNWLVLILAAIFIFSVRLSPVSNVSLAYQIDALPSICVSSPSRLSHAQLHTRPYFPPQHPALSPVSIVPNQPCRYATSPLHLATLSESLVRFYFVLVLRLLFPVSLTAGLLLSFNCIESLKLSFCLPRHQHLSPTLVSLHCRLCGVPM